MIKEFYTLKHKQNADSRVIKINMINDHGFIHRPLFWHAARPCNLIKTPLNQTYSNKCQSKTKYKIKIKHIKNVPTKTFNHAAPKIITQSRRGPHSTYHCDA